MFGLLGNRRLGLALGGGAARGFAHLGVLKALEDNGLIAECVAGTSAGSAVGALYAYGYSYRDILEVADGLNWGQLAKPTVPTMGLLNPEPLEKLIDELVDGASIEDLPMPFCAIATDLVSASELRITSGKVSKAVRASCSVPGVFVPLEYDDGVLVDGGITNNLPTGAVRELGADYVVAVDLNDGLADGKVPRNIVDVITMSLAITFQRTTAHGYADADIVIRPQLAEYSYQDMNRRDEMIALGKKAALQHISSIRRHVRRRNRTLTRPARAGSTGSLPGRPVSDL